MTEAAELPEKLYLPAMKSELEISSVEATMPPTLTWAPLPNSTPAELTMKT